MSAFRSVIRSSMFSILTASVATSVRSASRVVTRSFNAAISIVLSRDFCTNAPVEKSAPTAKIIAEVLTQLKSAVKLESPSFTNYRLEALPGQGPSAPMLRNPLSCMARTPYVPLEIPSFVRDSIPPPVHPTSTVVIRISLTVRGSCLYCFLRSLSGQGWERVGIRRGGSLSP